jgi:UDP-N-acetylmuramyl tripeptide synthase
MKAFDVATVNKMDPNDYILYQISKSKKYDMELLEDEAVQRGMEKMEISHVLTIHTKGYTPLQISDLLTIPIARVLEIIEKYGELK